MSSIISARNRKFYEFVSADTEISHALDLFHSKNMILALYDSNTYWMERKEFSEISAHEKPM